MVDSKSQGYEMMVEDSPDHSIVRRFAYLAFFIASPLLCIAMRSGYISGASTTSLQSLSSLSSLEVMPDFHGSSLQYGGYGFASGGHFSAALQSHAAGSTTAAFLLDHRFEYVVRGELHVTDGSGQSFVGKAGDMFFLPYGSNITHYTPDEALTYVSIAEKASPILPEQVQTLESEYRKRVIESGRTTQVSYYPQIEGKRENTFGDVSHLFFDGLHCFKWNVEELKANARIHDGKRLRSVPTWNFCSGVFHLQSGPPSFTSGAYKNHEELDFILDGEFSYTKTDGQKFEVKKGDLIHNPRHLDVQIGTPSSGVFLSTSLSPINDFFPN